MTYTNDGPSFDFETAKLGHFDPFIFRVGWGARPDSEGVQTLIGITFAMRDPVNLFPVPMEATFLFSVADTRRVIDELNRVIDDYENP